MKLDDQTIKELLPVYMSLEGRRDLVHGNEGWKDEQRIRRKGNSYDLLKDANRLLTDALDEANEDKASLQAEIDRLRAPRKPLPTRKPSKPQRILSKPQGAPGRMRKKAHNTGDSKGTSHGEPQQTSRGPRSFRR